MANWLNQLQSLLGQQGRSSSSDEQSSGKNLLLPGALGGLAGLLVASKSSRKLLAKYGTGALLVEEQLRAANVDVQGRVLIDRALAQPLDPQSLAQGISSEQEALEVYYISCAVIDIDHFMERSYLNALGEALKLPQEVREDIERDIQAQKQSVTL